MFNLSLSDYIRILKIRYFDLKRAPIILNQMKSFDLSNMPLPDIIEIETWNICNGTCEFCPTNRNNDPRKHVKMNEETFLKLIDELAELGYTGAIGLYSGNEPLMDKRVYDWIDIAKAKLPNAYHFLFTNAEFLTESGATRLIKSLDHLWLDLYYEKQLPDRLTLEEIYVNNAYEVLNIPEDKRNKSTVLFINKTEKRNNRAGTSPNVPKIPGLRSGCRYPFVQAVIRSNGDIGMCCNNPLKGRILGNITNSSFIDIWNGPEYTKLRKEILNGRSRVPECQYCDVLTLYNPKENSDI